MPASHDSQHSIEDLREYVDAFRTSSNRSRYALYVVMIASVLIGIATLNAHRVGWPLRRLGAWYGTPLADQRFFGGDTVLIKIAREEYLRQFVGRGIMASSPITGVSMDVNDLGLVGGTALVLTTLVMLFCLLREHENLQLALYKVRRLCAEDGDHTRGDSPANLLYHALAMGQVLSSPPTLARWRRRSVLRHIGFIFFTPAAVQLWVLGNNWDTRELGAMYGANVTASLILQGGLALCIIVLCASAFVTSGAMSKRWERVFYRVNPSRWVTPQASLLQWMKLPFRHKARSDVHPRMITAMMDQLKIEDPRRRATVPVEHRIPVRKERIHKTEVQQMIDGLFAQGTSAAAAWCSANGHGRCDGLAEFNVETSRYLPLRNGKAAAEWVVGGTWTFYCLPDAKPGTPR
jgi:hypothetical protein